MEEDVEILPNNEVDNPRDLLRPRNNQDVNPSPPEKDMLDFLVQTGPFGLISAVLGTTALLLARTSLRLSLKM